VDPYKAPEDAAVVAATLLFTLSYLIMKSTSLFLAAAFALCANAAFAQTTPGTTTSGTMTQTPGTMSTTPSTGTMNTGTTGTMNNGTGTMNNGTGTMNNSTMGTDRATMRSNRRMNKGSKMKSKTSTDGAMKSNM